MLHKEIITERSGGRLAFVMSDATNDAYGDEVDPRGWDLKRFNSNPIALFNHDYHLPIGQWKNVRVENGALRGELALAEVGTSELVDTLHKLVDQDILKSVSVGFLPLESEPLNKSKPWEGMRITRQELFECSLVSVPANPSCVLSKSMQKIIFNNAVNHGKSYQEARRRIAKLRAR